jgi:hypothetical protein
MKNDVTQKFVPSEVNDFLFFLGMTYVHINVERPREINIQRYYRAVHDSTMMLSVISFCVELPMATTKYRMH